MSELGPSARRVLADYAGVVGPEHADATQNWNDLVRKIERGEPSIELAPEPATRGRARIGVAASFAAVAAAALLWFGGRATIAALEIDDRPSASSWQGGSVLAEPEPAAVVDHVVVVEDDRQSRPRGDVESPAPQAPDVATPEIPAPATVVPPAPVPVPKKAKLAVKRPVPAASEDASALEQVGAIRKAYAALRDGDGERALQVLDDHRKRWPSSAFAGERDLLRVRALCTAGRKHEAELAAAAFKRKHHDSPLGAALKQCADDEP